jgi:acetyl esterase/lipase
MRYFSKTVLCLAIQICTNQVFAQDPEQLERFKLLDTNNDNQISAAEAKNAKWFKAADKDRDGIVTLEEGQAFLKSRGGPTAKEPAQKPKEAETSTAKPSIKKTEFRYHETPGVEANLESLDLYLPSKAKNSPVLVYIHGGGWQRGDKKAVESKATFYGSQGWIVASVNYRLVPDGKHPNNVQDVANAIAWVHTHAAEHGGDPERIFVMGHSAGAHLAALVATGEKWLEKSGKSLSVVKGVVELDTQALDVVRMIHEANSPVYEQAFGSDEATLRDASPMEHVSKGKSIPAFLLVVAGGVRAKISQTNSFQEKLRAADVRCDFIQAPEHDHGSLNHAMGVVGDKTHEAVWKFLKELANHE